MYADQIVYNTFEKDSFCSTAMYGANCKLAILFHYQSFWLHILADGTISVHNYATQHAPNGTVYTIDGYAYQTDDKVQGKLKVHFDSSDAAPFDAPYWILTLGPIVNGQYDYAIVSDNINYFLFVLARDVATFNAKYNTEVLAQLETLGFTGIKKPIATYQGTDCVYEANVRKAQIAANAAKEQQFKATL